LTLEIRCAKATNNCHIFKPTTTTNTCEDRHNRS